MDVKPLHADLSHIGFCDAVSFSVIVTFIIVALWLSDVQ